MKWFDYINNQSACKHNTFVVVGLLKKKILRTKSKGVSMERWTDLNNFIKGHLP